MATLPRNTLNGIKTVTELGLGGMELEFVQNVNVSAEAAPKVKIEATEYDVVLTAHGSYYINLNSKEPLKVQQSKERILQAARILWACGGKSLTFHAAFYLDDTHPVVAAKVEKALREMLSILKAEGVKIQLRPETTGKPTQFGTLEEIIALAEELDGVQPCIDFAHLHARSGAFNTYEDFAGALELVEKRLGKQALQDLHIHLSGIAYSNKGERNHLPLRESDFNYLDVLRALKDFAAKGVVVCESPLIEKDALVLKQAYERL